MRTRIIFSNLLLLLAAQSLSAPAFAQSLGEAKPATKLAPELQARQTQITDELFIPQAEVYQLNLEAVKALSEKIKGLEIAIAKFKEMGVGVTAFEQNLEEAKTLLKNGRTTESEQVTEHLNLSLQDQQKRFYASKILMWRSQLKLAHARHASLGGSSKSEAVLGLGPRQTKPSNGSELSKGASSVISKTKGDFSPLIYPIAR